MGLQKTVSREITLRSIGLHTGRKITMTIRPAEEDTGIVFVRRDVDGHNTIKAKLDNVCDTRLATSIGINGTRVATVEHLLSAFRGMGVDNAIVELDGPEVPIMDGSALHFVSMIKQTGTLKQSKEKQILRVKKMVAVSEGESKAILLPANQFEISYKIQFNHPLITEQDYHAELSNGAYETEICPARTFGFLKDVEYLQAKGLALGGSLKNAIVLTEDRIVNKEGLRFPDEFVKHKVLDAIGDLSLIGMPILGHFWAYKSGHRLNILLLRELLTHKDCWDIILSSEINFSPPIREEKLRESLIACP